MTKRNADELNVIKKGEAATLLGFGTTAGYRYLDFLELHRVLLPIKLPGLKTPRYHREEVMQLLTSRESLEGIPAFEANN